MEDVKRILVVSRSTTDCKKAFHCAVSLARVYKAELSILHIMYDPFALKGAPFISSLADLEKEYQAMARQVKSELDRMIGQEKAAGLAIRETVKDSEPIHEVMTTVQEEKIDLLVMAAHDETRIEHVIYGRMNHEIVRRLPCSVFLVKGE